MVQHEFPTTEFLKTSTSWYNSTSSSTIVSEIVSDQSGDLTTLEGSTRDMYTTTTITEGTGAANPNDDGDMFVPNIVNDSEETPITNLILSKIAFGPACMVLLITSIILMYLILRHFRHLLRLYLSLIFYTLSQLLLVAVLLTSTILQLSVSVSGHCDVLSATEILATILPGYAVLFVSVARWVCVAYPTSYEKLLNLKVQVVVMVVVVALLALMTCLPVMGVCHYVWTEHESLKMGGYCAIKSEGCQCSVFKWLVVIVGYFLPFLGVVIVYCLIVKILVQHKKKESTMSKHNGIKKASDVDYSYKPITLGEKLSHLRAIGQDAIPWSIVVILVLNAMATLPWIPQIFAQEIYYDGEVSKFLVVDIVYCVMLFAICISPAAYFMTTPAMRSELLKTFSCGSGRHKQFSVMSKNTESSRVGDA